VAADEIDPGVEGAATSRESALLPEEVTESYCVLFGETEQRVPLELPHPALGLRRRENPSL
jgi:hypothetical protein